MAMLDNQMVYIYIHILIICFFVTHRMLWESLQWAFRSQIQKNDDNPLWWETINYFFDHGTSENIVLQWDLMGIFFWMINQAPPWGGRGFWIIVVLEVESGWA